VNNLPPHLPFDCQFNVDLSIDSAVGWLLVLVAAVQITYSSYVVYRKLFSKYCITYFRNKSMTIDFPLSCVLAFLNPIHVEAYNQARAIGG
jgi:hypothetical protein